MAAKAGYRGFEPWVREIQEFVTQGGSPGDLKKRAADLGLSIESAIGFADWRSTTMTPSEPKAWSSGDVMLT